MMFYYYVLLIHGMERVESSDIEREGGYMSRDNGGRGVGDVDTTVACILIKPPRERKKWDQKV